MRRKERRHAALWGAAFLSFMLWTTPAPSAVLGSFGVSDRAEWLPAVTASASSFDSGVRQVWGIARLEGTTEGATVAAVLSFLAKGGFERLAAREKHVDDAGPVYFPFRNEEGFPDGRYRVLFLLDGVEAGTAEFLVSAAAVNLGDREEGLRAERAGLAGIDAYRVLWPLEEPVLYGGEPVAFLLQKVRGFQVGEDGKCRFDIDYLLAGTDGETIASGEGILGEDGHVRLPGGVAETPYVEFSRTDLIPPGRYTFSVTLRDAVGGGSARYTRRFSVADIERERTFNAPGKLLAVPSDAPYRRYLDPMRRFGLYVPRPWILVPPEGEGTALCYTLDPGGATLGLLKVNVYGIRAGGASTEEIAAAWRKTLREMAEEMSASIEFGGGNGKDLLDPAFDSGTGSVASSRASLEYVLDDGRRLFEERVAVFAGGQVALLTLLTEEGAWDADGGFEGLDWREVIPGSFLAITSHWAMMRLGATPESR